MFHKEIDGWKWSNRDSPPSLEELVGTDKRIKQRNKVETHLKDCWGLVNLLFVLNG